MPVVHRRALIVPTRLGPVRVEFTAHGLAAVALPPFSRCNVPVATAPASPLEKKISDALQRYAAGAAVQFDCPCDWSTATKFQQRVWRALQTIPPGETRSYAWVARQIGSPHAARAVGAACGQNPTPIVVPCHRVIASSGALGGFSAGLAWKKRLLALEQIKNTPRTKPAA